MTTPFICRSERGQGGLLTSPALSRMDRERRHSLSSQPCPAPLPSRVEPIPGGYRVIDANGVALSHVYGQPPDAVAFSDMRLTDDEARRISKRIARLPELVELLRDRNKARSRREPQPLRFKPLTIGDL